MKEKDLQYNKYLRYLMLPSLFGTQRTMVYPQVGRSRACDGSRDDERFVDRSVSRCRWRKILRSVASSVLRLSYGSH